MPFMIKVPMSTRGIKGEQGGKERGVKKVGGKRLIRLISIRLPQITNNMCCWS